MRAATEINRRVQARYDALMHEGKHGHYETLFHIVHEEIAAERERCAKVCEHRADVLMAVVEGRPDYYTSRLVGGVLQARAEEIRNPGPSD